MKPEARTAGSLCGSAEPRPGRAEQPRPARSGRVGAKGGQLLGGGQGVWQQYLRTDNSSSTNVDDDMQMVMMMVTTVMLRIKMMMARMMMMMMMMMMLMLMLMVTMMATMTWMMVT